MAYRNRSTTTRFRRPVRRSIPTRTYLAACIVENALREHIASYPYYQGPLSEEQRGSLAVAQSLLQQAQHIARDMAHESIGTLAYGDQA